MRTILISRAFNRMKPTDLLSFSMTVKTNLSTKNRYTALEALTKALQTACDDFTLAEAAAASGDQASRINRDLRMVDLRAILEKVAMQVEVLANSSNDPTLAIDAGFGLRGKPGARTTGELGRAEIVSISRGKNNGSVKGKIRKMNGAKQFAIEWSSDNGANWHNGIYSRGTLFSIENLEREKRHWFRVYPVGTGGRSGSWSEPVTLFVL